ncbi:hypothetical protein L1049_018239 [Liquidambar formosana]|uniref:Uncharacterized protein n=1 Tax=Liquidambar formosana TaxID=63359 RepID=A0AAP0WLV0_LIQFO
MDISPPLESINGPKPPETYEPMLIESLQRFLADYRNGVSDFSCFSSIFSRLVQTMTDPPLEITWFYSAVTFRTHNYMLLRMLLEPVLPVTSLLVKWLLIVEDQGVRVFDHDITKLHAKAVIYESRAEYEVPVYKADGNNLDDNLFYSDSEERVEDKVGEDQEMFDSVNTAFLAATHTMNLTATAGRRKRKEGRKDEGETRVKFVKVHLHGNTVREKFLPCGDDDGLSSGSEVDNSVSNEDMEVMEQ